MGEIDGCKFYMAADQFEYCKNSHIVVDVTEGRGSSLSLEIPLGLRFMDVSRMWAFSQFLFKAVRNMLRTLRFLLNRLNELKCHSVRFTDREISLAVLVTLSQAGW